MTQGTPEPAEGPVAGVAVGSPGGVDRPRGLRHDRPVPGTSTRRASVRGPISTHQRLLAAASLFAERGYGGTLEAGGPVEQRLFGHRQASVAFARGHADLLALIRLAATQIGGELGARVEGEVVAHKRLHRQRLERVFAEAVAGGEVVPGEAAELAYL